MASRLTAIIAVLMAALACGDSSDGTGGPAPSGWALAVVLENSRQ